MKHARIGLVMCPLWFTANWAYNASLSLTSVASSTVISTLSSLFTLLIAVALREEHLTLAKAGGVLLSMTGAAIVGLKDAERQSSEGGAEMPVHSALGDAIAVFAALMYGVYTVVLRRRCPSDDEVSMPLVLGYMGLFNAFFFGVVVVSLEVAAPVPPFAGLSLAVLGLIVAKGLADNVLSDYLWARAVVLTTPTMATVGLTLTVPIAFLTDFLIGGESPGWLRSLGSAFVVGGFFLVNFGSNVDHSQGLSGVGN